MTEIDEKAKSVGQAKSLPFGAVLRKAIKSQFGTGKEFAAKSGISEGRVSQLLSGYESLTAQTLEDILRTFSDLSVQEVLHSVWVTTFAPSPLQSLERREREASSHQFLSSLPSLMATGKACDCVHTLARLQAGVEDIELSFRLQRASVEVALFLGRSQQAQRLSQELTNKAKAAGEMVWTVQGLWLEATAARTAPALPVQAIIRTHEVAAEYLAAWNPASLEGKDTKRDLQSALSRDRALTVLAIHERRPVHESELERVIQTLDGFLECDPREETKAVFLEVRARVLLAKGDIVETEDSLDEAQDVRGLVSADHQIKAGILKGQLLFARGLSDQAEAVLMETLEACYELDGHHHGRSIERILNRNPR